jgi:hypothetical protein
MKGENMSITALITKYGIEEAAIDTFAGMLIKGSSLKQISAFLGIDLEKSYSFSKLYAKEIIGEPIDELCPSLTDERFKINRKKQDEVNIRNGITLHNRKLNDLSSEILILIQEKTRRA